MNTHLQLQSEARPRKLVRLLSFVLRHQPAAIGIELDLQGWTDLAELARRISLRKGWEDVTNIEIRELVEGEIVERFQVRNGRIRALYGHSMPSIATAQEAEPPELLFHATKAAYFTSIKVNGIRPGKRSYAHLTSSLEYALRLRASHEHAGMPSVLFGVQTRKAFVRFDQASEQVWIAEYVPPYSLVLVIPQSSSKYEVVELVSKNTLLSFERAVAFSDSKMEDHAHG